MIRKLLKSLREYKKPTLLTIFCAVIEVVFEILIPLCMSDLLDFGIEGGKMSIVVKDGTWLIVLAALQLLTGVLAAVLGAKASAGFSANLRQDIYDNVQTFSFSNIDKFSTSSIVTRLTTDVTNIQNAYQMIIRIAVRGPIMLIFSVIVSFTINAKLAWIFLIVIPFMGFGLIFIATKVHPIFERVFHKYDGLNNIVQENVKGMRVVKSFNSQEAEIGKFKHASGDIYKDFVKAERILAFNSPLMQFFMYGCMIAISWIGAKAIVASGNNEALGLTTGKLTALITYAMQILMSLMMLSMVFVMIMISRSSTERIVEVLEETTTIQNPENPVQTVADGSIVYDHVDFSYSKRADKKVIDGADLKIRSGETVGIIGGTGSAKSSLVNLISRLYDVSSGSVKVGGVDVRDYHMDSLRNQVAVVLQKNVLFSGTILENLRWGNKEASEKECRRACQLSCADDFIEKMPDKYNTYIEQGGTNVSGGQKQRLCIARALLKKPKILILDDSTSAVDTATDARIREAFAKEIPGTTKLIIAQRISSVQGADRIIVMNDGQVDGFGTHGELLANNQIYREVYESQTQGGGDFDEKGGV